MPHPGAITFPQWRSTPFVIVPPTAQPWARLSAPFGRPIGNHRDWRHSDLRKKLRFERHWKFLHSPRSRYGKTRLAKRWRSGGFSQPSIADLIDHAGR